MKVVVSRDGVVLNIGDSLRVEKGYVFTSSGKGYPEKEVLCHDVDVPDGVGVGTHCYNGTNFVYNPNYPFEANAKSRRDELLKETDWTQVLDAQISKESQAQMRTYRQALRDITEQDGYPYNIVWPEKPTITSGQIDPVDTAFDVLVGEGE